MHAPVLWRVPRVPRPVEEPSRDRSIPKLLIENQVLGERTESQSELTTEEPSAYINRYINGYERPRTSSDQNPKMTPDHGQPAGGPLHDKLADTTGYLLSPSCSAAQPVHPVILVRAPRVPVPPGTHGDPQAMTDRNSLTVHGNIS
jgi:hypothetical protein